MKIVVLIVFILSFSTLSAQTLQRNWGVEYKDTLQKVWGTKIASDLDGNVCISLDSDSSYMYMIKYTNSGEIVWNRNNFYYPEQFKERRPNNVGRLEYDPVKDVYHYISIRQSFPKQWFGTLLSLSYLNNNIGTSQGFYPTENSSKIYIQSVIVKSKENLFLDNRYYAGDSISGCRVYVSTFNEHSRLLFMDTINIIDSILPIYNLWDTKIDRKSNSLFHLFGFNFEAVLSNMIMVSKSDLSMVEDTINNLVDNRLFTYTSSDLGVPNHSLMVREMLLKDDKIYICGFSFSSIRQYHPYVATISTNGELLDVDFPFGKERSVLPRDYCFSSDSSTILFGGETVEFIQSNTISRPTVKGFSLITKDTFSFEEVDRVGRYLAVTASSNGTIIATGLDVTSGPYEYMYTASYSGIPLSVQEKNVKPLIIVSPNPSSGLIRLSVLETINGTVTISNIYGQEMLKLKDYQVSSSVDVSWLPNGFYFLSYGDREKLTTSFVLTK